ncbi:MAG: S53 family peptidase [Thermogemmatispora sp.]|uniref:S53 family peptidase n=1 Tax=Thermogemmatispora sp. TaxID=1968838 RepID=UPI00260AD24C|nr:S53 family peptidase [Thermogemmatispora sp.]MBX5456048.1 S53 family peptidase [Thermogemmatispora sp.]
MQGHGQQKPFLKLLILISFTLGLAFSGCTGLPGISGGSQRTSTATATPRAPTPSAAAERCPPILFSSEVTCYTPLQLRQYYGFEPLIQRGYTGKGQTIIDIVSFGSPTLQQDLDVFSRRFQLPLTKVQVIQPIQKAEYDPHHDKSGWAGETELDVEIIHALAPEANIVVLVSPVAETEGTVGLPEFRQLIQYAIDHHLGTIVSQSWGASEVTLEDAAGRQEVQKWNTLLQKATLEEHMTFFSSSGDQGATDYADLNMSRLSPKATTSFAADVPWVTSVGGTTLLRQGTQIHEIGWSQSGGGFSALFSEPSYQKLLPSSAQAAFQGRRGVPDVAAAADPGTNLAFYFNGVWETVGGTSASAPMWAALAAIANQMAGHPLGFLNPALYTLATSANYQRDFHDITVGDNSVHQGVNVPGYLAGTGWDAVTGLGSPNAQYLIPDLIRTQATLAATGQ